LSRWIAPAPPNFAQRLEGRTDRRGSPVAHQRRLNLAHRRLVAQWHDGDIRADQNVQLVREGHPTAGSHECLRLDGLVAVPTGAMEHVFDQPGGGAAVRTDPRVAGEVGHAHLRPRQAVASWEERPHWVGEEGNDLDALGGRVGLEGVLEDDGEVELTGAQLPEGDPAVDQLFLDDLLLKAKEVGWSSSSSTASSAERYTSAVKNEPRRTLPRRKPARSASSASASESRPRMAWECSTSNSPASVGRTPWRVRRTSCVPSWRSSAETWREMADGPQRGQLRHIEHAQTLEPTRNIRMHLHGKHREAVCPWPSSVVRAWANTAVFFMTGAVYAAWATRSRPSSSGSIWRRESSGSRSSGSKWARSSV
jgi:hypothetical protein